MQFQLQAEYDCQKFFVLWKFCKLVKLIYLTASWAQWDSAMTTVVSRRKNFAHRASLPAPKTPLKVMVAVPVIRVLKDISGITQHPRETLGVPDAHRSAGTSAFIPGFPDVLFLYQLQEFVSWQSENDPVLTQSVKNTIVLSIKRHACVFKLCKQNFIIASSFYFSFLVSLIIQKFSSHRYINFIKSFISIDNKKYNSKWKISRYYIILRFM